MTEKKKLCICSQVQKTSKRHQRATRNETTWMTSESQRRKRGFEMKLVLCASSVNIFSLGNFKHSSELYKKGAEFRSCDPRFHSSCQKIRSIPSKRQACSCCSSQARRVFSICLWEPVMTTISQQAWTVTLRWAATQPSCLVKSWKLMVWNRRRTAADQPSVTLTCLPFWPSRLWRRWAGVCSPWRQQAGHLSWEYVIIKRIPGGHMKTGRPSSGRISWKLKTGDGKAAHSVPKGTELILSTTRTILKRNSADFTHQSLLTDFWKNYLTCVNLCSWTITNRGI